MITSAVITGAASGIGLGLAKAIVGQGGRVILADIEVDRAAREAAQLGPNASAHFVDHADEASIAALADHAFEQLGTVDGVFANAGIGAGGALHTTPQRNVDWVLSVNLMGPLWLARHFLPRLIAQSPPARFIVTGSEHSVGLPSRGGQVSIYTVSKHAVLGLAETLRRDLADTHVSVGIICPAVVTTDIWDPMRNRHERFGGPRRAPAQPVGQIGLSPDEAAARILAGVEAGEFYLFSHGKDLAEVSSARADEIAAAIARFQERFGPDT